jgi:type VI secretion system protein ImpH
MSALSLKNLYDGDLEKEDFFALARQYERNYIAQQKSNNKSYSKIGEDGSPSEEAIRFKTVKSLGFSLDSIQCNESTSDGKTQYEFFVSFIGLLGSAGILPQHYIKMTLERIKHGDFALAEFIGLFEHRLISLYYKAWAKYKFPVQYESADKEGGDNFSVALKSFSGFNHGEAVQLYYSGHFAKNTRPHTNLQSIIAELLTAKVSIKMMQGRWLPIRKKDRCVSGVRGRNHQLGSGVILGSRYWDIQSKIVIQVSEITMDQYLQLKTESPIYQRLSNLINAYVPVHISVCLEFQVKTYRHQLSTIGNGFQLSQNAWLMGQQENTLISKRHLMRL